MSDQNTPFGSNEPPRQQPSGQSDDQTVQQPHAGQPNPQPPYGQSPGQPSYGYGQGSDEPTSQQPHGGQSYGQPSYGQQSYEQPSYQQPSFEQQPYAQSYGQPPYSGPYYQAGQPYPQFAQQPAGAPAPKKRKRHTQAAIAGIAAAFVFGAAGIGYAVGHSTHDTSASSQTQQSQTMPSTGSGGWGSQSEGGGSSSGETPSMPQLGGPDSGSQSGSGSGNSTSATSATEKQEKGLVYIDTSVDYGEAEAAGTGMILTSDGTILTNHHVIEGATTIKVQVITTGKTYNAKVIGYDSTHDVAVLKLVGASGLDTVKLSSTAAKTGDKITAVGNANGDGGDASAATGTVTATGQSISVTNDDNTQSKLSNLIQLDADVISGDSGGAVYNSSGKVVGMTTAASSGSAEVTGYAIPISQAKSIANQILNGESSTDVTIGGTAFLGVQLSSQSTTTEVAGTVSNSPAAKAGITEGSTVTAINGTKVSTASGLTKTIQSYQPGDTVTVSWTDSSGASHSSRITLTTGPVG